MSDTSAGRRGDRRPQGLRTQLVRFYHRYRPTLVVLAAFVAASVLAAASTAF